MRACAWQRGCGGREPTGSSAAPAAAAVSRPPVCLVSSTPPHPLPPGLVWWQRGSTYTLRNATDVLGAPAANTPGPAGRHATRPSSAPALPCGPSSRQPGTYSVPTPARPRPPGPAPPAPRLPFLRAAVPLLPQPLPRPVHAAQRVPHADEGARAGAGRCASHRRPCPGAGCDACSKPAHSATHTPARPPAHPGAPRGAVPDVSLLPRALRRRRAHRAAQHGECPTATSLPLARKRTWLSSNKPAWLGAAPDPLPGPAVPAPTPSPPPTPQIRTPARQVVFVSIAYWFGGLNRNVADFFSNLGTLILTVLVAESWGLLLGGVFMEAKKAQTATTGERCGGPGGGKRVHGALSPGRGEWGAAHARAVSGACSMWGPPVGSLAAIVRQPRIWGATCPPACPCTWSTSSCSHNADVPAGGGLLRADNPCMDWLGESPWGRAPAPRGRSACSAHKRAWPTGRLGPRAAPPHQAPARCGARVRAAAANATAAQI